MALFRNFLNNKIGRWTVLCRVENDKNNEPRWLCRCECGTKKIVSSNSFISKKSHSCGCLKRELTSKRKKLIFGEAAFNRFYEQIKRDAIKRNHIFSLTKEQVNEVTQKNCTYCGIKPKQITYSKNNGNYIHNGLDRIDNTQGYIINNVTPCCGRCNRAKDTMTIEEFKRIITNIYINFVNK